MPRQSAKYPMPALICALSLLVTAWHADLAAGEPLRPALVDASPASQNLDGARLEQALRKIDNGDYGDIDALLVIRNNSLVLEKYFAPEYRGREYRRPVLSVTKTITSALVGIAIGQGKIEGVEKNLLGYFPEYVAIKNLDSRKRQITLEDVLTMTAGIQWNELAVTYADPQNDFNKMVGSPDWVKYVIDSPMSHAPGEYLNYSSGCTLLLSGILQKSTASTAEEFAIEALFKPLGIETYSWTLAQNGLTNTFSGLAMQRRDMAKFGLLFLQQGRWRDQQLIPREWVKRSTRKHVTSAPEKDGSIYAYAYQWWRFHDQDPTVAGLEINDIYFAWGYGGQFIVVIPHLHMVVVSTANNYGADYRLFFDLLREQIFPAVLD